MRTLKNSWAPLFDMLPGTIEASLKFPGKENVSIPPVNVQKTENAFLLSMAAPGYKKEDFKISIEENKLVISAEANKADEESTEKYTRREFIQSSFSRSFVLPENIDSNEIKASYEQGILELIIPIEKEIRNSKKEIAIL